MFVPQSSKSPKSKVKSSPNAVPQELKTFQPLPSHEQISQRAYAIYQSGGEANGRDQQDWFRAEREMFANRDGTAMLLI
jgi:hypothetical protein